MGTNDFFAYILVVFICALIAVIELINTFKSYAENAIKNRWAWWSVIINCLFGVFILYIMTTIIDIKKNIIVIALSVGFGFQVFIRTNFIIARQNLGMASDKDFTINVGWIYQNLQDFFKKQIEKSLMKEKRQLQLKVRKKFSVEEIKHLALDSLPNLSLYDTDQIEKFKEYIGGVVNSQNISETSKLSTLVNFIIDKAGIDYIEDFLKKNKKKGNKN